ncbi:hypothetical protein [Streptomyces sp. NPDC046712]|uniref:hypothetical protein n=1 Tax=Streptomyces sp. NPDC046712 TaxID=3154802 RepID=UPI0033EF73D6
MRRGTRLGALLAGVLVLAGCGIRQSDVVEAGGPATIAVVPVSGSRMLLFYVDADGRLLPVARELGGPLDGWEGYRMPPGEPPPTYPAGSGIVAAKALTVLLLGPNKAEAAAGLTTRLPAPGTWRDKEGPHISQGPDTTGEDGERRLRIRLPFPVGELDGAGIRQLVCTAAYAEEAEGRASVVLSGPGGSLPAEGCDDLRVGSAESDASDVPREGTPDGGGTGGTVPPGPTGPTPSATDGARRQTPTP